MSALSLKSYHPSILLRDVESHGYLGHKFQEEVLNSEEAFCEYVTSYGLKDHFINSDGSLKLKHLPEDAETFIFMLRKKLSEAQILSLKYSSAPAVFRNVSSYTNQIKGNTTNSVPAENESVRAPDPEKQKLFELRNRFFAAILDAGTKEEELEKVLNELNTEARRIEFCRLVIDDPRAAKYKGAATVEEILAQEFSGRDLGRTTGLLGVRDGERLLMASLNTPTYQNLVRIAGTKNARLILSASVAQIEEASSKNISSELKSAARDLLSDVQRLAAESKAAGILTVRLPDEDILREMISLSDLLLLKNIYAQLSFQIEEMQNLAKNMKDTGLKDSPMDRFKKAHDELEYTLAKLCFVTKTESAQAVMQTLAQKTGTMLREAAIFKMQEGYGLSQYESMAKTYTASAVALPAMTLTIGVTILAAPAAAAVGIGASGSGSLSLLALGGGTLTGTFAGGTVQAFGNSYLQSKEKSLTALGVSEIFLDSYKEQFMNAAGVATGMQIGQVAMSAKRLEEFGKFVIDSRTLSKLKLTSKTKTSLEKMITKMAPRGAKTIEGISSNITIGLEHNATQMEFDPWVLALWALTGMFNRGILSVMDDTMKLQSSTVKKTVSTILRNTATGGIIAAKDWSMEAGEEIVENLITEGFITPEQLAQSIIMALQEFGSTETASKMTNKIELQKKVEQYKAKLKSKDSKPNIESQTPLPPWENQVPAADTRPQSPSMNPATSNAVAPGKKTGGSYLVRYNAPPEFLSQLADIRDGLAEKDYLLIGWNDTQGFPIRQGNRVIPIAEHHAKIIFQDGRWLLRNLDKNLGGTLLNGEPVISPRRLKAGDIIRLGLEMEFVFPGNNQINTATDDNAAPEETKKISQGYRLAPGSARDTGLPIPDFSPFVPDSHVLATHAPAGFEKLAELFYTEEGTLLAALDQNTDVEHGFYKMSGDHLEPLTGRTNFVDSRVFAAEDEESYGGVDELDVIIHTHGKHSPEPSREDLTALIAKARLNPGKEQKLMSLGFVNGAKSAVAILAEFDPETATTHLNFLATRHARANIDSNKLNALAKEVDAELATLDKLDLSRRAQGDLGSGQGEIDVDHDTGMPIVPEPPEISNKAREHVMEGVRHIPIGSPPEIGNAHLAEGIRGLPDSPIPEGSLHIPDKLKTEMAAAQYLGDGNFHIGRHQGCAMVISDDMAVSRSHGRIFFEKGKWYYQNFSQNGSQLNDKILLGNEYEAVNNGDILKIGDTAIVIELPKPEQKPPPETKKSGLTPNPALLEKQQAAENPAKSKNNPDWIHQDPNENAFLPGQDTLENRFGDNFAEVEDIYTRTERIVEFTEHFLDVPVTLKGDASAIWNIVALNEDGTVKLEHDENGTVKNNVPLHDLNAEMMVILPSGAVDEGWHPVGFDQNGHLLARKTEKGSTITKTLTPEQCHLKHTVLDKESQTADLKMAHPGLAFIRYAKRLLATEPNVFPERDFQLLFKGDPQQANVGNCWLVAAFHSLRHAGLFEIFIRTSMRKVSAGIYEVRIPIGSRGGRWIQVSPADITAQKNLNHGQQYPGGETIDDRSSLHPIQGSMGYAILEAAYMKANFGGRIDRADLHGGHSDKALVNLFGNNVTKTNLGFNSRNYVLASKATEKEQAESYLEQFDNRIDMATVSTLRKSGDGTKTYTIDGITFYHGHAYAIESVDRRSRTILVANPNGGKIELTYDQFMRAFSVIRAVRLDYNNLFEEFAGLLRSD